MRRLLFSVTRKDLVIDTFCAGGKGGQHQNRTRTGVRVRHPASGAAGESREHKSQAANKKAALRRLAEHPKFKVWLARKVDEVRRGKTLEERVEEAAHPRHLKVEVRDARGKWTTEGAP